MSKLALGYLCGTRKYDADYWTAYNADVGDWHDSGAGNRLVGADLPPPGSEYRIYRCHAKISVPDVEITKACIQSRDVYSTEGFSVEMYDATSLEGTCKDAHYGDILDLATCIGSVTFPVIWGEYFWKLPFNDAGLSFLNSKRGGDAKLAFRSTYEPSSSGNWGYALLWTSGYNYTYGFINEAEPHVWVEGTSLAYIDTFADKRLKEGTLTGTTGKTLGYFIEGNRMHYIDANGDERRISGTLTGLSGKQPAQISVNTKQTGKKLCFIDSSGNERCFEGTAS